MWKIVYLTAVYTSTYKDFQENFVEYNLNDSGYKLLSQNKIDEAIEVFKLNVKLYPESLNVYDSLGEAYMKKGENDLSIENYLISLKLDPNNKNAEEMINKIRVK